MTISVAFITAIYGDYDTSCKKYAKQSIECDFICFTNNPEITNNNWIIDTTPYHLFNKSKIDNGSYINSISNNQHTFNIAKYYKQNFYNIPRLNDYKLIIWIDGSIQVTNCKTAEYILEKIKTNSIVAWQHEFRDGPLKQEVIASNFERYTSNFWFGQHQPYQDVLMQYNEYIKNGYVDIGVWITCFIGFDNKCSRTREFLDFWYLQTLMYTTQDQIGFPYSIFKTKMYPYTLPNNEIFGKPHSKTDFFIKHNHGQ